MNDNRLPFLLLFAAPVSADGGQSRLGEDDRRAQLAASKLIGTRTDVKQETTDDE
jgi:hypothetical protein